MNMFFYTILLILFVPLILIWFVYQVIFKGNYKRGFAERFGRVIFERYPDKTDVIWIHAASVGEILAAEPLTSKLKQAWPSKVFVFTTNTDTGYSTAKEKLTEADAVYQTPFDLPFCVNAFITRVNPSLLIVIETELWPNMISVSKKRGIPVLIANGRISDRACKRYLKLKWFFMSVLSKVDMFIMQYPADAEKIIAIGADSERVRIAGNVKYDRRLLPEFSEKAERHLQLLDWDNPEDVLVAGSTHPREEIILCDAFRGILVAHPEIKMVLAPRHPGRVQDVCATLKRKNLSYVLLTELADMKNSLNDSVKVLVLNVMGELLSFYSAGGVAFVGGSLQNIGGHNVLEPAALSKPVLFGPYTANFRDAIDQLLKRGGGKCVKNAKELVDAVIELRRHPEKGRLMGAKALSVVEDNRGAVDRHVNQITHMYSVFAGQTNDGHATNGGSGE
jgi:3-deoxy-D-manno-octulosonic-acid transferase